MAAAALLAGGFLGWQMLQFDDAESAKDAMTESLRNVWR
jgi:hypothetical protein